MPKRSIRDIQQHALESTQLSQARRTTSSRQKAEYIFSLVLILLGTLAAIIIVFSALYLTLTTIGGH